jgi:protein-L-isoaspartate(D-aspartate) O-methyltransferase
MPESSLPLASGVDREFEELRRSLLHDIRSRARPTIAPRVEAAFWAAPRHSFVTGFRNVEGRWTDARSLSRSELGAMAYKDTSIVLWPPTGPAGPTPVSTLSQPSFVLEMLTLLDLRPGQRVLEIGTGSGWSAAMAGHLVGSGGEVITVEIVPELAEQAAVSLHKHGATNVTVREADGILGLEGEQPFDRIVYTAASPDLPAALLHRLTDGGHLLFVLRVAADVDCLIRFERVGPILRSTQVRHCRFVSIAGSASEPDPHGTAHPFSADQLAQWSAAHSTPKVHRAWFGVDHPSDFGWMLQPLRLFLAISLPGFKSGAFADGVGFAVVGPNRSVAVARYGTITQYGSASALNRLQAALRQWVRLGMPTADAWRVTAEAAVPTLSEVPPKRTWTMCRGDTTLVWELD